MAEEMVKGTTDKEFVPIQEASKGVKCLGLRLGLLHMSYAEAIIEELGEEKGMKLISKVIKKYSIRQGEKMKEEVLRKGLEPTLENYKEGESYALPTFPGIHERIEVVEGEGIKKHRCYGCVLAKLWKEHGKEKMGRLYCYVDLGRTIAYNPNYKIVHIKAIPDGDEYCELEIKHTTEEERKNFFAENNDWFYIDK